MPQKNKNLLIIAGEVSGDLIGASLVKELKKMDADLNLAGIGGNRMKTAGSELIFHIDQMSFLGFAEVLKHLPFIRKVRSRIIALAEERQIRNAILIDYPGFNLNLAKKLKARGIKIIYYVSPQVWAWGSSRLKKMKMLVDEMLVVFPFEKNLYEKHNINVHFVGHPLAERVSNYKFLTREELYNKFELDSSKEILLLMPGSRMQEIKKIFPESLKAAINIAGRFNMQVVVACSDNLNESVFKNVYSYNNIPVVKGFNFDLMKHAKFGIIKSGTSTLEAAYFALPMIIVYKTSLFTYLIVKKLITLDKIGMANILLGDKIIPELIQDDVNEDKIVSAADKILSDKAAYEALKERLKDVREKLGKSGASERAANIIYQFINEA